MFECCSATTIRRERLLRRNLVRNLLLQVVAMCMYVCVIPTRLDPYLWYTTQLSDTSSHNPRIYYTECSIFWACGKKWVFQNNLCHHAGTSSPHLCEKPRWHIITTVACQSAASGACQGAASPHLCAVRGVSECCSATTKGKVAAAKSAAAGSGSVSLWLLSLCQPRSSAGRGKLVCPYVLVPNSHTGLPFP